LDANATLTIASAPTSEATSSIVCPRIERKYYRFGGG
jgi:hypothetical protein